MIFPRTPKARRRYGRNKVLAIIITFAIFFTYIKVFVPKGVILSKLNWEPRRATPARAFEERWSGVIVAASGSVEAAMADSVRAGEATDEAAAPPLARSRVRTGDDHPIVLLYDATEAGFRLDRGDLVDFRGVYSWSTGGGFVRALEADSTDFGVERLAAGETD